MKQFVVLFALALATASANFIPQPGFPEGRIINGYEAEKGEAPFIVSLQSTSGSHFCGGSILRKDVVLTAAHCLTSKDGQVVAGAHSYKNKEDVQVRKFTNAQYVVHEKYSGGVGPNDIGLILLKDNPFNLNAVSRDGSNPVSAVNLPSKTFEGTGEGFLYGWGRDNSGSLPENLQKLDTNVIGYSECKAALPSNSPVAQSNVCSYTAGKPDGACNGDSGGPLVTKSESGVVQQVGIVSWGYTPCATTTYPSVFTAVSEFKDWINENC
ncbi:lectizyme [Drosophila rhopaloa]|uniref:Lectizyme n=1 Tax=Drosophila rhopaloa TaxID=1041015 RepID=A0A6P4FK33_DRORH|nr:lectizyme [Drosophila rhopaloa]